MRKTTLQIALRMALTIVILTQGLAPAGGNPISTQAGNAPSEALSGITKAKPYEGIVLTSPKQLFALHSPGQVQTPVNPPKPLQAVREIAPQLHCKPMFFEVEGRPAFLLKPLGKESRHSTPWVWYAPTLPVYPATFNLCMFRQFLAQGIAIAGIDVGESYGNPQGRAWFTAFYNALHSKHGMAKRACLMPQSRGGLMLYNWAAEHPDAVACVAGIYTVCNMTSWPGLKKACAAYGMSEQDLAAHLAEHNPIDRLKPLAEAGVPILHVHGDCDKLVPLEQNSGEMARRYRAAGGTMRLIVVKGLDHQVAPEFFECQELIDFVITQTTVRAKME